MIWAKSKLHEDIFAFIAGTTETEIHLSELTGIAHCTGILWGFQGSCLNHFLFLFVCFVLLKSRTLKRHDRAQIVLCGAAA